MSYNFERFNARMIEAGDVLLFNAARKSGKTTYLIYLMKQMKTCPKILIISKTDALAKDFAGFVPSSYIKAKPVLSKLEEIIEIQAEIIKIEGRNANNHLMIVFDDCMGDEIFKSEWTKSLFSRGRHFNITLCITMQYAKGIMPEMRDNLDWVFALFTVKAKPKKMLYEEFFGHFDKYAQFQKVFAEMTKERGVMIGRQTAVTKSEGASQDRTGPLSGIFFDRAIITPTTAQAGDALYQAIHQKQLQKQRKRAMHRTEQNKKTKKDNPAFDGIDNLTIRI